jgi:hypothetical protein
MLIKLAVLIFGLLPKKNVDSSLKNNNQNCGFETSCYLSVQDPNFLKVLDPDPYPDLDPTLNIYRTLAP